MYLFNRLKRSFQGWAEGSPKMEEDVFKAVNDEFNIILYLSCIFLDLRPKHRMFSMVLIIVFLIVLFIQLWMFTLTVTLQMDDFESASLSAELAIMITTEIVCVMICNMKRQYMIRFFRCLCEGYYDYKDGLEIPEMALEIKNSRKQKLFVMIVTPTYLSLTAVVCISGRAMDSYAGVLTNASYVNDVYVMGPFPTWFPFKIMDNFGYYAVFFGQVLLAGTLAGGFSGVIAFLVISAQSIVLQLKLLRFRLRKVHRLAYKLYLKRGGPKLTTMQLYENSSYRECYNEYLSKCAAHHIAIIKGFNHFLETTRWIFYFVMVLLSAMFAMSLLLLVMGGKPSVLSAGLMLLIDEVVNISIICWQSEQIQDQEHPLPPDQEHSRSDFESLKPPPELADHNEPYPYENLFSRSGVIEGQTHIHDEETRSLPGELYNTKWIYMGKRASTTLRIMMERCKEPMLFTAAISQTPVNWETYAAVLNTAYSYVNLLAATKD